MRDKEKKREYDRNYHKAHPSPPRDKEKKAEYDKKYHQTEKYREYRKKWMEDHGLEWYREYNRSEKMKEYQREYYKKRIAERPPKAPKAPKVSKPHRIPAETLKKKLLNMHRKEIKNEEIG